MKLCIVTSSFPLSDDDPAASAGVFVEDFALAVAERGHAVSVLTQDKDYGDAVSIPGLDIHTYAWRGGARPLGYLRPYRPGDVLDLVSLFRRGARALEELQRRKSFDHVLAMWAVPAGWLARGLSRRHRVPYSVWCLGSDIWTYGRYPVLRRAVALALRDAQTCWADGLKLGADAEALAGRPVPFLASSRSLDASRRRDVALPGSAPHFCFVGRYHAVKGVDVLLEAMAQFVALEGAGHLHLYGAGPLEAQLRARADASDLRGSVTVGGLAFEQTVIDTMSACRAVLIPSRMESIPVVLSDALQLGRPVIVSDVGDMGTLLREQRAGLVVPPGDAAALCEAMRELAQRPDGAFSAAVAQLAERFDVARSAARWLEAIGAG